MELFPSKCLQCLVLLLVFVSIEHAVHGIECYQCNSGAAYNGANCTTIELLDQYKSKCPYEDPFNYTRCRKTVQIVLGETRTIRSCATAGTSGTTNPKCIDRIGTSNIKVKYCDCDTDLCNSARGLFTSGLLSAATAFSLVLAVANVGVL